MIKKIQDEAVKSINEAKNMKEWEQLRLYFLGKKGVVTQLKKNIASVPPSEKPAFGKTINQLHQMIEQILQNKKEQLLEQEMNVRLKKEMIDVSLPAKKIKIGAMHPLTQITEEIKKIFIGMGYHIAEGPEIESDYYNFEALNIPKHHPARDEQDTFYINDHFVLRTQTSPVQIRAMLSQSPPIKIIAPGRVYRSDEIDATHSPIFHQLEGMMIDKDVSMADLKKTLMIFSQELFGKNTVVRFRPNHFPFTEPSAEMDVRCFACKGEGCRICGKTGFIEMLGCGMVHPKVLKAGGLDPQQFSGFAFGMGIERIAMQRFEIPDIRLFYENDIKFLEQF